MPNILVIKQNGGKIEIGEYQEDSEIDINRKIFDSVVGYELIEDPSMLYDEIKTALIYKGDPMKFEINIIEM